MQTLHTYCENIEEKTVMFICNDCNHIAEQIQNSSIFIHTVLGIFFQNGNSLNSLLNHYLVNEKCTKVILVSHVNCKIFNLMFHSNKKSSGWYNQRTYLNLIYDQLRIRGFHSPTTLEIISFHISTQITKIIAMNEISDRTVEVKGFVIDDRDSKLIIEVEKNSLLFNLN